MLLKIKNNNTIADIQQIFSYQFPYLKITFFKFDQPDQIKKFEKKFIVKKDHTVLSELTNNDCNGTISLDKEQEVKKFEQNWENQPNGGVFFYQSGFLDKFYHYHSNNSEKCRQ